MNSKNIKARTIIWASLLSVLFSISCAEQKWNDYYSKPDHTVENLYDVLLKNTDYKIFTELLVKSGCDSILKSGSSHTVMAVKNEALASIDPNMPKERLKELMSMHITSSVLYSSAMKQINMPAISGKVLYFREASSNNFVVNDVVINTGSEIRTLNGVIYSVEKTIDALPNLYQYITSNSDLTDLNNFIKNNIKKYIDSRYNTLIGYDSLNYPIYEEPIIYYDYSEFLNTTQPDNELIQTSAFIPSNQAVKQALEGMLAAKGGNPDLIVPRLNTLHPDTIIAGRFFKQFERYDGDTTEFLKRYFSHSFVRGMIPSLSGTQTFTNINNELLTVSSNQVKASIKGSNGYCHIMNDIAVPDIFYRSQYWFTPVIPQVDVNGAVQYVRNPNIIFRNGANTSPGIVTQNLCHTGRFMRFNFTRIGGAMDYTFPEVFPGAYDVYLCYYSDNNDIGLFDVFYGDQVLVRNLNTSGQYNSRKLLSVRFKLGTIRVAQTGAVNITFVCTDTNPINTERFQLCMDYLLLDPVNE